MDRRMDAYYYFFDSTKVDCINKILSAVACAGKAYHSTECWIDDAPFNYNDHTGKSPVEWIQNAANEAADVVDKMLELLKEMSERYFCPTDPDDFPVKLRKLLAELEEA